MRQTLLLKAINPNDWLTNKNYKQTTDKYMQSLDRTEYLSKIEEIRMRIQTKQTQRDSKPKIYEHIDHYGENPNPTLKIDPKSIIDDLSKRRPLQSVQNKTNQFQERVKELDSVSERIKVLLSNKRAPFNHESIPKPIPEIPKNQKITSLFQKDLHFAESKVGEGMMGDFKSRDLVNNFKERLNEPSTPANNPHTSHIYTTHNEYKLQGKMEAVPQNQPVPVFDAEAFKKRFMNQISKEPSTDRLLPQSSQRGISTTDQQFKVQSARQQIIIKQSNLPYTHTKRLLQCLCRQIELEGKLRACKEKFDAYRAENKMELLKEEIRKHGMRLSEQELQEWVIIQQEEFDPFVSLVFTKDFDFNELLSRMMQAKKHWEEQVRGCVSKEGLEKEQFRESFRRSSISLEEIVCFVNLQKGCFLKNRDLFSLFKHLMLVESPKVPQEHRIKLDTFLSFVGR